MKNIFFYGLIFFSSLLSVGQTYDNVGELKEKLGDSFYKMKSNGDVLFKFEEEYSDGVLNVKLYNHFRQDVTPTITNLTTGNIGDKRLGVNIYSMNISNGIYILEVTDSKGKILKMRIANIGGGGAGV